MRRRLTSAATWAGETPARIVRLGSNADSNRDGLTRKPAFEATARFGPAGRG